MARFCAGLSHLFREWEFLQRFAAARECGFDGVELTLPYAYDAAEVAAAKSGVGVDVVLFTAPLGNFLSGGEGIAAVAREQSAFRDSVSVALDYAQALDARYVQFVAGRCIGGAEDPQRRQCYLNTYVENLHYALEAFAATDTRILIEAINSRDFPDYLLSTPAQVREVTRHFAEAAVTQVFDSLHLAVMGIDPVLEWRHHAACYAHVQLADAPNRSMPGSGTLDFPALYRELKSSAYSGWVGAEYHPAAGLQSTPNGGHSPNPGDPPATAAASGTAASLNWMNAARAALPLALS